jgi:hypothetical protein
MAFACSPLTGGKHSFEEGDTYLLLLLPSQIFHLSLSSLFSSCQYKWLDLYIPFLT